MIHTTYNIDIELIPTILDGEGFTEIYHKMVKLRISDSEISWTLKVQENVYTEYVNQLVPGMTTSEKMQLVSKIANELKNTTVENKDNGKTS